MSQIRQERGFQLSTAFWTNIQNNKGGSQRLFEQYKNIAKGTTDPGVDYFNQLLWFGLVGLVK